MSASISIIYVVTVGATSPNCIPGLLLGAGLHVTFKPAAARAPRRMYLTITLGYYAACRPGERKGVCWKPEAFIWDEWLCMCT